MKPSAHALSRRSFALLCGSATAAAAFGAAVPETPELGLFKKLSGALTGFPASALDARFARDLAEALAAGGRRAELERRLEAPGGEFEGLETEIIAAWYSGVLPTPSGPMVGTFRDALIWAALGFAMPPGVCGAPQDWSKPPQAPFDQ